MQTVSVSQLKAQLSRYLREVRRGGEVQVLDRGEPVARLIGLSPSPSPTADDAHRQRLLRSGTLRAGTGDVSAVLNVAPLDLEVDLRSAIDDDRSDRM
jgi:prevent-host-death family protein